MRSVTGRSWTGNLLLVTALLVGLGASSGSCGRTGNERWRH